MNTRNHWRPDGRHWRTVRNHWRPCRPPVIGFRRGRKRPRIRGGLSAVDVLVLAVLVGIAVIVWLL